ncbi:MAG: ABC transporter ATP-binding protein [Armatimonadetes bacterium]|nr:ABC transporter ATP-binding protein [Armatimonadota bacterium]MDW8121873.1 ATP-binding cassette domain-containing protein [Armatimonadota bacterium]
MIQVSELTKYYGETLALSQVSFTVQKGEIVGFLGPNGAGKTTTMRILAGYLSPSSGSAKVGGYDVVEESLEVRRIIGYLPETVPIYSEMRVREYLTYMARIRGVDRKRVRSRVDDVIERCGLRDVADRINGHLSKGYRQRVGVAQALVHEPKVLILDEPTIGLDPVQVREIRQLIKELAGDHTVILSTHILPEVSMTCQRVLIIHKGRLIAEDSPENLSRGLMKSQRILVRLQKPPSEPLSALKNLDGVLSVERRDDNLFAIEAPTDQDLRPQIAEAVVKRGWGLLELRSEELTLEEIFINLVTKE